MPHRILRIAAMPAVLIALAALPSVPASAAVVPNDDFDAATVVTALPFTDVADTTAATEAPDDPTRCHAGSTVWYAHTAAEPGRIVANTFGSAYDTTLSAYTGTRGALTELACNDDDGSLQSSVTIDVAAGTTYYFMVGVYGSASGGPLTFTVDAAAPPPPPPPNDDFDAATQITALPFTDSVETSSAVRADDDPACGASLHTVWYAFTAPSNAALRVSAPGSAYYTNLSAYSGARGALSQLACTSWSSPITVPVEAGSTYYLMVGAMFAGGGQLQLSVQELPPPPANDDITGATQITTLPFADMLDTRTSTHSDNDPSCADAGYTVWYVYTAPSTGTVRFSTAGSSYDTNLSVHTGTPGALQQGDCRVWSEPLTVDVAAATTYYILVGTMWQPGGDLRLSAELLPPRTGIGNSQGIGGESLCPAGTAVTGVQAGLFSFSWGTVVGSVAAICGGGATSIAPTIGNAVHETRASTCPDGQFATALSGRGGDLVDAVRVHCQALDSASRPTGPINDAASAGAGGGSPQGPFSCPDGEVLVGLRGTFRRGSLDLLDYVEPVCGVPTYRFEGLFDPVSNDALNTVRAGQTVPVGYRIIGLNGRAVDDPASFRGITTERCDAAGSGSAVFETAAGNSGLQYLDDGTWQFNWKTPKDYAGQCRTMTLLLDDGSSRTATFQFS